MMALQNRPRPRTKFSENSSGTIILMLAVFVLLIRPWIDFFSASQAMRWNSALFLSVIDFCISRRRAGGIYAPPARVLESSIGSFRFALKAFWKSFNRESSSGRSSVVGFGAGRRPASPLRWSSSSSLRLLLDGPALGPSYGERSRLRGTSCASTSGSGEGEGSRTADATSMTA